MLKFDVYGLIRKKVLNSSYINKNSPEIKQFVNVGNEEWMRLRKNANTSTKILELPAAMQFPHSVIWPSNSFVLPSRLFLILPLLQTISDKSFRESFNNSSNGPLN